MPRIPTVFEARDRINEDTATPMDQFIWDHEPKGIDAIQFRKDLAKLLTAETAQMADHVNEVRAIYQQQIDCSDRVAVRCVLISVVLFIVTVLSWV